ncbi:RNA ligase family protein [Sphingosinicella sp. BN140058]|uniref:ATP-dependent DNA ligase n=1 Tax=Sphingosinicella sp. BN140058 TaxID=1892855 RepID=UPI00101172EB|nr:RNA ligase family protein [Sphingosinicella sp. BN140058]QAY80349.1 ATP-dependent DNA ligase [Sphingosinicella sp. BN140058]
MTSAPLGFIVPQAPTLAPEPPDGEAWQHEIKYDGYRTLIVLEQRAARLFTRNGHDWTSKYRPTAAAASKIRCQSAILDGEIILQDAQGRSDFHGLRGALARRPDSLVFMAFDLLHLDGQDLRREPLIERRRRLEDLVGAHNPTSCIQFSEAVDDGRALFAAADGIELEGIVSKKRSSRYRSGPSKSWLKVKCYAEAILRVIGTIRGDAAPFALLARETAEGLEYAGMAMVNLGGETRSIFWEAASALSTVDSPIPMPKQMSAAWQRPLLSVRVSYLKGSDKLRHASVRELLLNDL